MLNRFRELRDNGTLFVIYLISIPFIIMLLSFLFPFQTGA